jgi:uncharacterized sulfatase
MHEHVARGLPFDDDEWNAIEVLYDTCLAYVDSVLETVVDRARSRLDDPLVVITADHGEFFGEHGLLAHMLVPDSPVTDVPLVVSGLDVPEGADGSLVQHADVMAMLSETCDLDLEVPVGRDVRSVPREYAVTQRGSLRARKKLDKFRERDPSFDVGRYPMGELTSLRTLEYRYQRSEDGSDLFELSDEATPANDDYPEVVDRMSDAMDEWLETHGRPGGDRARTATFSEEMEEQLQNLGYI